MKASNLFLPVFAVFAAATKLACAEEIVLCEITHENGQTTNNCNQEAIMRYMGSGPAVYESVRGYTQERAERAARFEARLEAVSEKFRRESDKDDRRRRRGLRNY